MKKVSCRSQFLFLLFVLLCISLTAYSQEAGKQSRKEAREAGKLVEYKNIRTLLDSRKIIFETERVQVSTGAKIYNVVQVDGSRFYVRCENPQNTSGGFTGVIQLLI